MNDDLARPALQRVLTWSGTAPDAILGNSLATEAGLRCEFVADWRDLCQKLDDEVAVLILSEESLAGDGSAALAQRLRRQPSWSDLPVLLLAAAGADSAAVMWAMENLGNVALVERPLRVNTLVSAVRAALRARRRQFELRDRLQAQALLAAVVESSQDAIISKTLDGIVTTWNPGAERLFEYTASEAIGRPITFIIPPERQQEERMILDKLARGESIMHYETVRQSKSGRPIEISLSISPIRDSAGAIIGASKVARDVTPQKRAQELTRQSEERFRFLAESLPTIVWIAAPDGSISYVNQRWLQYGGTTPEQNARDWPHMALHPDDVERCRTQWARSLRDGKPYEIEVRNRRHDGVYRWFITRAVPFMSPQGHIAAWFGITTDIHDLKELQQQLRLADRRKDAFLATLAHELRNPLAPIRNGLFLLAKQREDVGQFEETRRMMETQLHHMVRLLDDLLDISRIARNKIQLRKERMELAWVVNDAIETARPLIEERNHRLTVKLPSQTVYLHADSVRLAQVVSNLLNNAAKYTPPGGQITVTAKVGANNPDDSGREVTIRVCDNGLGISADRLPRIFDLFVQGRDFTQTNGGLGIGLSLVKSLVAMHGGRVEARSAGPNLGSEFTVRLPISFDQEMHPPQAAQAAPAAAARRILVVDDQRDSADSMARVLASFGHETCTAYDGPQALAVAREFRPDAVLLDIGLPGMDGHELARRLRSQAGGERLILCALTGWGQAGDRQRSLAAGFNAHFVKPAKAEDVSALLAAQG